MTKKTKKMEKFIYNQVKAESFLVLDIENILDFAKKKGSKQLTRRARDIIEQFQSYKENTDAKHLEFIQNQEEVINSKNEVIKILKEEQINSLKDLQREMIINEDKFETLLKNICQQYGIVIDCNMYQQLLN